jgi:hypothetical protein
MWMRLSPLSYARSGSSTGYVDSHVDSTDLTLRRIFRSAKPVVQHWYKSPLPMHRTMGKCTLLPQAAVLGASLLRFRFSSLYRSFPGLSALIRLLTVLVRRLPLATITQHPSLVYPVPFHASKKNTSFLPLDLDVARLLPLCTRKYTVHTTTYQLSDQMNPRTTVIYDHLGQ